MTILLVKAVASILGVPVWATRLPPSSLLSFLPSRGLSTLQGVWAYAANHFKAIYAIKQQPYKIHIDV